MEIVLGVAIFSFMIGYFLRKLEERYEENIEIR